MFKFTFIHLQLKTVGKSTKNRCRKILVIFCLQEMSYFRPSAPEMTAYHLCQDLTLLLYLRLNVLTKVGQFVRSSEFFYPFTSCGLQFDKVLSLDLAHTLHLSQHHYNPSVRSVIFWRFRCLFLSLSLYLLRFMWVCVKSNSKHSINQFIRSQTLLLIYFLNIYHH